MELDKLKTKIKDITLDGMIAKYSIEFEENTMIINKKIPVAEFIHLRKNIAKIRQIDNVIVDGDKWKKEI